MQTNSTLRERFGVYLVGVAIGLMLVGMIFMIRQRTHQQREAARQPAVQSPAEAPEVIEER